MEGRVGSTMALRMGTAPVGGSGVAWMGDTAAGMETLRRRGPRDVLGLRVERREVALGLAARQYVDCEMLCGNATRQWTVLVDTT